MAFFKVLERMFVTQSEANIVESIQQAIFAERINIEVRIEAEFVGDGLLFEVDGDLVLGVRGRALEQRLHFVVGEANEDDAVLPGV